MSGGADVDAGAGAGALVVAAVVVGPALGHALAVPYERDPFQVRVPARR